jgi:hypothetical protein
MDGDTAPKDWLPQTDELFTTYPKDEFRVLDTALEWQAHVDIIAEKGKIIKNKD